MTEPILNQEEIQDLLKEPTPVGEIGRLWNGETISYDLLQSGAKNEEQLEKLVAVQTPQGFVAEVLRAALDGEGTDCASLVEARGGRVKVVEGDPRLLKVTTKEDLALVESWLSEPAS